MLNALCRRLRGDLLLSDDARPDKRQSGCIPYALVGGQAVFLLITSRRSGRWVFPKGSHMDGKTPWDSAAQEAYEEAGVEIIDLAEDVRSLTVYAKKHNLTIAVMGCRVNGPGETDDADLGLWCGPKYVNLKKRSEELGAYSYDDILGKLKHELDALIAKV